ncbi:MAG: hypothetical protein A3F43_05745 [Gammaproteobacteria bacterium RIFCSPHIGHO2_12_FULL_42_10]|nr:MAG: hypothetical protein A3F43_05745 [Gammaproteobacteria bacterium RIFCSPHIGHO2_12_FULL_42_10]
MRLLTNMNPMTLWQETIREAEGQCEVALRQELETYLVTLLANYVNQPDLFKQTVAISFLEAQSKHDDLALQRTGDQCLLVTGLFPHFTERKLVKINYFVQVGQASYFSLSHRANDLFALLANHFVTLMDVLQSIRADATLLPLEAYDQWNDLGSRRALRILEEYRAYRNGGR